MVAGVYKYLLRIDLNGRLLFVAGEEQLMYLVKHVVWLCLQLARLCFGLLHLVSWEMIWGGGSWG